MVFGGELNGDPTDDDNDPATRLQAFRTASCIKILGKGVIRVVHRVDDARENNNLGRNIFTPTTLFYF
jgi:hypothetical protein